MDMICPVCEEPWDNDTLHEVAEETGKSYTQVAKLFMTNGCGKAFAGSEYETSCVATNSERSSVLSALAEFMGEGDTDGYMAMAEDYDGGY